MVQRGLSNYFEEYLKKEPLFLNKDVFRGNYLPETIDHRDEQINYIAKILAPILKGEKPSNLFIYGKTGTGKTMSMKHVMHNIDQTSINNNVPIKLMYINCKLKRVADTEYRLVAELARKMGKEIPSTGLPTDEIYQIFYNAVEKQGKHVLVVMDEIDQLVKKTGDGILYNLTRCNDDFDKVHISLVGLSNDMVFIDNLDPRVRSSLSDEELVFPPYNAFQLQDILKQRASLAFKGEVLSNGVIEKCAAYSAREHGDARRALELLRVAGELAERMDKGKISLKHIDDAEEKLEKDRLADIAATQPKQGQCILYSIIKTSERKKGNLFTGEIYDYYKSLCGRAGLRALTQRRISDIIAELDMLGVINAKTISKGRYGRTREISLALPKSSLSNMKSILERDLDIKF